MCADDSEAGRLRELLDFFAPLMRLDLEEDRCLAYRKAWERLNPAAENENWQAGMAVNFPWSTGKVDLWRDLRNDVEREFKIVLDEYLNGEDTDRPCVEFSFMHYNEMLWEVLQIFLKGLDAYIDVQDHITAVGAAMEAYESEDERYMSEKSMRQMRIKRAKEFFDVIAFMHAVPQREHDRWDALDHAWDVTWFREHCKVYQHNEDLADFLRDCAVVVLLVGHFAVPPDVRSLYECYEKLLREKEEDEKNNPELDHTQSCDSEKCFC